MVAYITDLKDNTFDNFVKKGIVLIDLYADWCAPCKSLSPIIDEISSEYLNKIRVGKLNVDNNSKIPALLGIRSIPTILVYKDGEIVSRTSAVLSKKDIITELDKHI
jgi:thioredoxin 1